MITRVTPNSRHASTRLSAVLLAVLLLLPACARQPQPARPEESAFTSSPTLPSATPTVSLPVATSPAVLAETAAQPLPANLEEITFQSGEFKLIGDLRTPAGRGPFPVVLFVHGSGDADRTMFGYYLPIMERMLRAGYAVFSWDKPGYGESTGQLSDTGVLHQRAQIVLDAIEVMKERPDIDPGRIGLWGISQAGYVMPLVVSQSEDVAFMICVSCGGMSGHDEAAYQITSFAMFCADFLAEDSDQRTALLAELEEARPIESYEEYLHYRQVLDAFVDISPKRQRLLDVFSQADALGPIPQEAWLENHPEIEDWWNPAEVLKQVRIPVLAIFGDRDSNGDPMQGAYAWRKALEQAGNAASRVELLPGVDHFIAPSESSCLRGQNETFDHVLQEQGYGPLDESLALFQREPGQHTPLSDWPYAPGYLDLIEDWLGGLRRPSANQWTRPEANRNAAITVEGSTPCHNLVPPSQAASGSPAFFLLPLSHRVFLPGRHCAWVSTQGGES